MIEIAGTAAITARGWSRASKAAGWSSNEKGFERMESGFHARGRDLVRFGFKYLERGLFAGRRALPEGWVLNSTGFSETVEVEEYSGRAWGCLAGWWLVPRAEGPPDFCAIGRCGQFICV